jgi:hypothetical protein
MRRPKTIQPRAEQTAPVLPESPKESPKEQQVVRVTIDLSRAFHQRLSNLQEILGVSSKADVFRNAVLLLEYVAKAAGDGYELQLVNGEDRRSVVMPGLVPSSRSSDR